MLGHKNERNSFMRYRNVTKSQAVPCGATKWQGRQENINIAQ